MRILDFHGSIIVPNKSFHITLSHCCITEVIDVLHKSLISDNNKDQSVRSTFDWIQHSSPICSNKKLLGLQKKNRDITDTLDFDRFMIKLLPGMSIRCFPVAAPGNERPGPGRKPLIFVIYYFTSKWIMVMKHESRFRLHCIEKEYELYQTWTKEQQHMHASRHRNNNT